MPRRTSPLAIFALTCLLLACSDPQASPRPSSAEPSRSPDATATAPTSPTATAAPSESASEPAPTPPGQTDTEFGRIWDALPAGFPIVPGSTPTETGAGPASAEFDAPGNVSAVATFLQGAMEGAAFSTESLSGPLEGGQFVLVSVGPDSTECRVQTTVAPAGDASIVTVLYGAACPFE